MKILNIILVISITLLLIGLFYNGLKDNDKDPVISGSSNTDIVSIETSVLAIEDDTILVLENTVQNDILNSIASTDGSPQYYRITTSEGSTKSLDEVYEYDRLYVTSENAVYEVYYKIMFTDSLQ